MIKQNHKFLTMDATRGVAAICVMLYHYLGPIGLHFLPSGHTAVDFFFCLSGFIIAFSYGEKLASNRITLADFFVIRAIRLYPMYVTGTAVGIFVYFISNNFNGHQVGMALLAIPFSMFCLPVLYTLPFGGIGFPFPFNIPAWSLFFEIIVNVLYASIRWSKRVVYVLFAITSAYFVMTTLIDGQSGAAISSFMGGVPRAAFSFSIGALIFHLWQRGALQWVRINPIIPCCCVVAICLLPASKAYFFFIVFFAIPLIVTASVENPASVGLSRLFALLGEISYPLYAIHFPVYGLSQFAWDRALGLPLTNTMPWPAVLVLAVAVVCIAFVCARWLDAPIRRRVAAKLAEMRSGSEMQRV